MWWRRLRTSMAVRVIDTNDEERKREDLLFVAERWSATVPGSRIDPTNVEELLRDPNEVLVIERDDPDPAMHSVCRISVIPDKRRQEMRVSLLAPRAELAAPSNFLAVFRVLAKAIQETAIRHPDKLSWRIWARFEGGRDSDGNLDGGKALCEFWRDQAFPTATVLELPLNEKRPGVSWEIGALLSDVIAVLRTTV